MTDATPNIDNGDFSAQDPWDSKNYWAKWAGRLNGENIVLRERIAELEARLEVVKTAVQSLQWIDRFNGCVDYGEVVETLRNALGGDDD